MHIQIREEKKNIPIRHLVEVLNVSKSEYYNMVKNGVINRPVNKNGYTRPEIELVINTVGSKIIKKIRLDENDELADYLSCRLVYLKNGVFLVSQEAPKSYKSGLIELINEYGIWNAQGLNNHIHLFDIIDNPVIQLHSAGELVSSWLDKLKALDNNINIIIYWNGEINSTICIYSKESIDDKFISEYDKYLQIRQCIVTDLHW